MRSFDPLFRALPSLLMIWAMSLTVVRADELGGGSIATIDGVPVATERFLLALKEAGVSLASLQPDERERLKREILQEVIEREVLLREAVLRDIRVPDSEMARAIAQSRANVGDAELDDLLAERGMSSEEWEREIRDNLIVGRVLDRVAPPVASPTDAEVKAYYDSHRSEFLEPESVDVWQIVVPTEDEATAIRARLLAGARFEREALAHSTAPEAAQGGHVGLVQRGYAPEGLDLVFSLKPGVISPVVHTAFGYHVFKVAAHHSERKLPYADVAAGIRQQLAQTRRDEAVAAWIADRLAKASLEVDESVLARFDGHSLP